MVTWQDGEFCHPHLSSLWRAPLTVQFNRMTIAFVWYTVLELLQMFLLNCPCLIPGQPRGWLPSVIVSSLTPSRGIGAVCPVQRPSLISVRVTL